MRPPSETRTCARPSPSASMTALMSPIRCSRVGTCSKRSELAIPRLSNSSTRTYLPMCSRARRLDLVLPGELNVRNQPRNDDQVRTRAVSLIGNVEIAAARVPDVGDVNRHCDRHDVWTTYLFASARSKRLSRDGALVDVSAGLEQELWQSSQGPTFALEVF